MVAAGYNQTLACLIGMAVGIAFAVVTSILFLFWRGTPGRLNGRDGLPGGSG